jgi:alpha-amylase
MRRPIITTLFFLAACAGASDDEDLRARPHQDNAGVDWRDQVIYQVMIDRFENGDPNNDYNVEVSVPGRYHGGDWQGVIDRLDYLEELGVTTIWISPTFMNTEEDAGFASYHGYWPYDLVRPNHHFGDLAKLREMVDAAHQRGMLVILDVIVNHMGQLFYYDINGNGQPDDFISGGGTSHTCTQICSNPERADECSEDERTYCQEGAGYLERIIEWDPEYDPRGVQGWTSVGFRGPAEIRFTNWPEIKRTPPPRPPDWFGWPADKPWFDSPAWYNRHGRVYLWWHEAAYSREFVRDQETLGDFPGGLKDLDTDHPDVQEALVRVYQYWMEVGDFDGFRIDTLKHIDRPEVDPDVRGFYGEFATRIREHARDIGKQNFFIFGEAFDGNDELSGAYTFPGRDGDGSFQRIDSTFYFSQYYRVIKNVFMGGAPTREIACLYGSRMGISTDDCAGFAPGPTYYGEPHAAREDGGIGLAPQQVLVNFLDNHDLARFLFAYRELNETDEGALEALHSALFFLFTWDGIPCVYYGTEQGFAGGVDPGNREDMAFDTASEMFARVKSLIALRKEREALRRGAVSIVYSGADTGLFAFERSSGDDKLLVVVNTRAGQDSAAMTTSFAPGTTLTDIAPGSDGASFTVGAGGSLEVAVPSRGGRLLAP